MLKAKLNNRSFRFLSFDYSPKPPGFAIFIEIHKNTNKNTVRFAVDGHMLSHKFVDLNAKWTNLNQPRIKKNQRAD